MKLRKSIPIETIRPRLAARDKQGIIEELVDLLHSAGKVADRKSALRAVLDREKKMTTGMQNGVAIPHGRSDSVNSLVAAFGMIPEGVDFESLDGNPATIFVLTLSPANRNGPHIEFLGSVNRLLIEEENRAAILRCETAEEIFDLLKKYDDGES